MSHQPSGVLSQRLPWRREIAGLRALAVIPVMLFHAESNWLPSGYVGVDIFFVISGYLLTAIVGREMASGTFSVLSFFERRARRILPALLLVMLCCIPFAWQWMMPDELQNFGQSLVATSMFANNVLLWLTSGYFNLVDDFKPLMHTWSLAVEEQFYLLFPFLMLALYRLVMRKQVMLLAAVIVCGFLLLNRITTSDWQAGFLLLPFRAWELLAGVALAAWSGGQVAVCSRQDANMGSLAGLLLVLCALFLVPSYTLAVPMLAVSGTLLLLYFGSPATYVGRLLSGKLPVATGLMSYSLYLWHQPLLAFLRLPSLEPPSALLLVGVLCVSFILAFASWRLVELPWQDRKSISATTLLYTLGIITTFIIVTGMVFHLQGGFPQRFRGVDTFDPAELAAYTQQPMAMVREDFLNTGAPRVLVVGNSFARDFINMGRENGIWTTVDLIYRTEVPACLDEAGEFDALYSNTDILIFGSGVDEPTCWQDDHARLSAAGISRILVVGSKNFGWNLNGVMQLPSPARYAYRAKVLDEVWQSNLAMAQVVGTANYIDLLGQLADAEQRVPVFTPDNELISWDNRHLTPAGARYLGTIIFGRPQLQALTSLPLQ